MGRGAEQPSARPNRSRREAGSSRVHVASTTRKHGEEVAPGQKGAKSPAEAELNQPMEPRPLPRAELRDGESPDSCPRNSQPPQKGHRLPVAPKGGQKGQPEIRGEQEHTSLPGPALGHCQHKAGLNQGLTLTRGSWTRHPHQPTTDRKQHGRACKQRFQHWQAGTGKNRAPTCCFHALQASHWLNW